MKNQKHILLLCILLGVCLLMSSTAFACANCYKASSKSVLHAYYMGYLLLSGFPLSIIGFAAIWFYRWTQKIKSFSMKDQA